MLTHVTVRIAPVLACALVVLALCAPASAPAATCADYPNQAAAQRAHDTRDSDRDGLYCESLPCPCSTAKSGSDGNTDKPGPDTGADPRGCVRPRGVQNISFSATKYPNIRGTPGRDAQGWPPRWCSTGAAPTNAATGCSPDSRPVRGWIATSTHRPSDAAMARALSGRQPRGWRADVRYVPSAENRSHGSTLGIKLRRFCNGTRFRYVFY